MSSSNIYESSQPDLYWEQQFCTENQTNLSLIHAKDDYFCDFGQSFDNQYIYMHEQLLTPPFCFPPLTSGWTYPIFPEEHNFYAFGSYFDEQNIQSHKMLPFPSVYVPSSPIGSTATTLGTLSFYSGTTAAPTEIPESSIYKYSEYVHPPVELASSPNFIPPPTLGSTPSNLGAPIDPSERDTAPTGGPTCKIHKCSVCDHTSQRRSNVKAHEVVHISRAELASSGKLYFCCLPGCKYETKGFSRRYDCRRHILKCLTKRERLGKKSKKPGIPI